MAVSRDEAKQLLINGLPPGIDALYDFNGDIGRLLYALGGSFKQYAFDMADTLRAELNPISMSQKTADWEGAFGLAYSRTATYGTAAQRRNQVFGYLRALGEGFSLPGIRSIAQMFLQHSDPTTIDVQETNRASLKTLHTITENLAALAVGANTTVSRPVNKVDMTNVSPAGAQVRVNIAGAVGNISFNLFGPDGFSKTWAAGILWGTGAPTDFYLYAPEFYGHPVAGEWIFELTTGADAITFNDWSLFVEGMGREPNFGADGLGGVIYEWGVVHDPALASASADLDGLRDIIPRIKPAHTRGVLIRKRNGAADLCVFPEIPEAIPDECVPC